MKQKIRYVILPFWVTLILFVVAVIDASGVISSQRWNIFKNMSNICMFIVGVIGFFGIGWPNKKVSKGNAGNILSNVTVPITAIVMDAAVFENKIQLEHLLDSLRGWTLAWIVIGFIQILFLSGLGTTILGWIKAFGRWFLSVFKSVGELAKAIQHYIFNVIRDNKNMFLITLIGVVVWGVYIVVQINIEDVATVFSESNIVRKNILPWVIYFSVCIMLYIFLYAIKVIKVINESKPKSLLAVAMAIVAIIVFDVIVHVLPSILVIIAIIILIPFVAMFFFALAIRIIDRIRNSTKNSDPQGNGSGNVNIKDLIIVIVALVGIPLIVICSVVGELFYSGQYTIAEDENTLSTLLHIINIAGSVAKELLELVL